MLDQANLSELGIPRSLVVGEVNQKSMIAARGGGDPDYLANSDQFECAGCKQVFDNDDSVDIQGGLYCTSCSEATFAAKPCPHCKTDLYAPESVERHYVDKDAGEDAGEDTDAIGYGHYNQSGDFEPDSHVDLSCGRFDLLDDSDRCASCGGQL